MKNNVNTGLVSSLLESIPEILQIPPSTALAAAVGMAAAVVADEVASAVALGAELPAPDTYLTPLSSAIVNSASSIAGSLNSTNFSAHSAPLLSLDVSISNLHTLAGIGSGLVNVPSGNVVTNSTGLALITTTIFNPMVELFNKGELRIPRTVKGAKMIRALIRWLEIKIVLDDPSTFKYDWLLERTREKDNAELYKVLGKRTQHLDYLLTYNSAVGGTSSEIIIGNLYGNNECIQDLWDHLNQLESVLDPDDLAQDLGPDSGDVSSEVYSVDESTDSDDGWDPIEEGPALTTANIVAAYNGNILQHADVISSVSGSEVIAGSESIISGPVAPLYIDPVTLLPNTGIVETASSDSIASDAHTKKHARLN